MSPSKKLKRTHEHWIKFKELKNLVEKELNSKLFFDGIETYQGAEYYLQSIQNDAKKIKTLITYQNKNWKVNFIQRASSGVAGLLLTGTGYILVPPTFAAEALFSPLGLEYFDEIKSSRFLFSTYTSVLLSAKITTKMSSINTTARKSFYLLKF